MPRRDFDDVQFSPSPRAVKWGIAAVVVVVVAGLLLSRLYQSVPAGHVAVATLFGKVIEKPYPEGLHFPVNPLFAWTTFDVRDKTLKEDKVAVPSQDQLNTLVDVSVQYRLKRELTPRILAEVGEQDAVIAVHLEPMLRSLIREQGKTVKRAEDFFQEQTQQLLQTAIHSELRDYLAPRGIEVQAVLLRNIELPEFIREAVAQKKEREQAVEREKAELDRNRLEQERIVVAAEAKKKAAESEAMQRRLLAEAQAFEIQQINDAIASNPAYIQLEALKTLQAISKDPAAKVYFLNGESPQPLPLMMMGEPPALPQRPAPAVPSADSGR
jgi:regulator of protease activity HflC (stomatin/prohibitin superfamily)